MFLGAPIASMRERMGRFSFLLLAILLMFLLRPFLEPFVHIRFLSHAFFSLILLSGIQAISEKKRDYVLTLGIGAPAFLLMWSADLFHAAVLTLPAAIFAALFFTLSLILIVCHVNRQREVTRDVVMGAVCAYFLIGIVWAYVYFFLEWASPGSFSLPENPGRDPMHFFYYSFITLTTVGYGDILPVSPPARSFAILEAMVGQMYLAVAMARLVAVHISQAYRQEESR